MAKDYTMCATVCQLLSMVAIPMLLYFGYLGYTESRLLEIPLEKKQGAAVGCWIAAAMYAGTYVLCKSYKDSRSVGSVGGGVHYRSFGELDAVS
ncbi:unnamed protein product [Amoebophrya sp. A25]|nr:unnamed protein product [Amoebophrya sp. A25]|eukprot:GSA25T00017667001.1